MILAFAGFIVASTAAEKNAAPAGARAASEVGFRIASRYAVGVHRTVGALQPPGGPDQAAALLPQVDAAAVTRDDKVRAAIVAGEIGGAAAAAGRLDALAANDSAGGDDLAALRALYAAGTADALSAAQRQDLLARHGWYGQLAVSFGNPGDSPARRAALRPAVRTAVAMLVATLAALAALLIGLALLLVAIVRWAGGQLVPAYRPARTATGPFLEAFAAYIAGMVGFAALARWVLGERLASSWLVVVILPFTFLWPLLRGVQWAGLRRGLGWHAGRGVWREIGAGVVGYLAGLPVLAAGAVISLFLQRYSGSDTSHPIVNELGGGLLKTAQLFLLAAVWAPLVEETMFRGAFYHHLRARFSWPIAAALVAVLFAAVHPQGWAAIPVLGGIAFSFATIREWRGSIIAPVVAHAINNGAVTLLLVTMLA